MKELQAARERGFVRLGHGCSKARFVVSSRAHTREPWVDVLSQLACVQPVKRRARAWSS